MKAAGFSAASPAQDTEGFIGCLSQLLLKDSEGTDATPDAPGAPDTLDAPDAPGEPC